jgi:hypothetical protein
MYEALLEGRPVLASKSLESGREYVCPRCLEKVVLKKGLYVAPHFAHYPETDCPRKGGGESKEHASLKVQLHNLLSPEVARGETPNLRIEAPFGEWISDLGFTTPRGRKVAVEVTVKNLSFDHFRAKMKAYRRMKVYPLWLFSPSVLKGKSKLPLTPEHITERAVTKSVDWVELEGLYRPPRVMLYLHSFLGCVFLVLPDGLPVVIRLSKPEATPRQRRRRRQLSRRIQVLSKCYYPLSLNLVISRYDGQKFPRPARTPMIALSPQGWNCGRNFYGNPQSNAGAKTRVLVSERTAIRFNFSFSENARSEGTYNA